MRANPEIELRGDRNECPGCGGLFNSTRAFERHRLGRVATAERRCATEPEMLGRGMARNKAGFWVTELRPEALVETLSAG